MESPIFLHTFQLNPRLKCPSGFPVADATLEYSLEFFDELIVCLMSVRGGYRIIVVDINYQTTLSITPAEDQPPFKSGSDFYFFPCRGSRDSYLAFYSCGETEEKFYLAKFNQKKGNLPRRDESRERVCVCP